VLGAHITAKQSRLIVFQLLESVQRTSSVQAHIISQPAEFGWWPCRSTFAPGSVCTSIFGLLGHLVWCVHVCCKQDGQEFLKLLLSKLEVVFTASQREVGEVRAGRQSLNAIARSSSFQHPCSTTQSP
jgi:hypothetical protein